MDISSVTGYNTALSLISSLSPTSRVASAASLGGLLSPAGAGSVSTTISSLGRLLNAADALQTSSADLAKAGALSARTVASSRSSVATATATTETPTGTYVLQVNQLAQGQALATASKATSLASIGGGSAATLNIQFASGEKRQISLAAGDDSLAGIASAINASGSGLEAKVLSSEAGYQLSLSGPSGAGNAFSIAVTGNEGVAELLAYPADAGGPTQTRTAQDARGVVNGTAFSASTNTVNTAVAGLAVQLVDTGRSTLSVSLNSGQTQRVSSFVEAYNEVVSGLSGVGRDNPLQSLNLSLLRGRLDSILSSSDAATLARIGITRNSDGTLSLSFQQFQDALDSDPEGTAQIFRNDGNGLAERAANLAEGALSPSSLLQAVAPDFASPSSLAQGFRDSLFSSLFSAGALVNTTNSASFSDQYLNAGQQVTAQNNAAVLESLISQSQGLTRNLASLGQQWTFSRMV